MIAGKHIPIQILSLFAALVIDEMEYPDCPTRAISLKVEKFADASALSKFLWANVNREKRCDVCKKYFDWTEHPASQYVFSVAVDAESNILFLHKGCASSIHDVVIEGQNHPDTMHQLEIRWRGPAVRALIAPAAVRSTNGVEEILQVQRDAQRLAELTAEPERRRAYKAKAMTPSYPTGQRPMSPRELKSWLRYATTTGAFCPGGCSTKFATDEQYIWLTSGRIYFFCRECALTWVQDRAALVEPSEVAEFLSGYKWSHGGHGLEVVGLAGVVQ